MIFSYHFLPSRAQISNFLNPVPYIVHAFIFYISIAKVKQEFKNANRFSIIFIYLTVDKKDDPKDTLWRFQESDSQSFY